MKPILLLLIFSSSLLISNAQWTADTNVNTEICTATYKQKEQRLESDGNGGAFVVWRDWRPGDDSSDIYVQRLDSNGVSLWGFNGLNICNVSTDESAPSITTDEKDGIIVCWSDERSFGDRDVYAQRIDGNGNILWTLNGVPVANKPDREHSVKIISDDNSGAIIVWEQERPNLEWDIWAQRIDSSGNVVWASGGISVCTNGANRINHKIQRDGEGGFFVTWQDERSGDFDIYVQRIDGDGNLMWNPGGVAVCSATNTQTNPKIDPEKQLDGVFIAWVDKRNGNDYDIYANRIDSMGNVLWGATGKPVAVVPGNQSAIDILSNNKTNGLIVSWKDKRSSVYDIYAQKLDLNGDPNWALNGVVVCDASGEQLNPNIISDKNGGAIIAWQDARNANWDIYTQRINYLGQSVWDANGIAVSTAPQEQLSPKNIPDNKGGSIYVWEDKRGGISKDIYAHHILIPDTIAMDTTITDTTVIDTTVIDTTTTTIQDLGSISNFSVYPNPFQHQLFFNIELIESKEVTLKIVSVIGEIIYQERRSLKAKKQEIKIDTKALKLAEGIYILELKTQDHQQSRLIRKQE